MNTKQILTYLEKYKEVLGLHKFKILVNPDFTETKGYATVVPDIYEKELKFAFSPEFKKLSIEKQKSILLHELVHGRLNVFQLETALTTEYIEEQLCNDLERGLFKIIEG